MIARSWIIPYVLGLSILLFSCSSSNSEEKLSNIPGHSERVYRVNKVIKGITLDGLGKDSLWQQANLLQEFVFPWQDRIPPETSFRALYNEKYFYFKFEVADTSLVLWEDSSKNMAVTGSDRVELFFAANDSLKPYFQLEMDPRTWVFDARSNYYRKVDSDWKWEGMQTYCSIFPQGYILEGRIPMDSFETLGLWKDAEKSRLLCGIFRAEFVPIRPDSIQHNWISWIIPQSLTPDFHIPSAFGQLLFES